MQTKLFALAALAILAVANASTAHAQTDAVAYLRYSAPNWNMPTKFQAALPQPMAIAQPFQWDVVERPSSEEDAIYEVAPPHQNIDSSWATTTLASQSLPITPTASPPPSLNPKN